MQAAIITFLLHLIAALSPNYRIQTRANSSAQETPVTIVSLLLRSFN
ncbi:hypothetical protein N9414_01934 [Nodularia spumigena CCY9414]|nr:hypothetical protein N9414_01934 [Nodularia spumigena CCY9414]